MITPRPLIAADVGLGLVPDGETFGVGDPTQAWLLPDLIRAEWSDAVDFTPAWVTDVDRADSGAETRRGRRGYPTRLLELTLASGDERDVAAMTALLQRFAHSIVLAPLWCEKTETTSATAYAEPFRVNCDTTERLFVEGQWVALIEPHARGMGRAARFELLRIEPGGVEPTRLTVKHIDPNVVALSPSYPKGSRVVPLMECEPILAQRLGMPTGVDLSGRFAFRSVGNELLESQPGAWAAANTAPAGAATYDGLPVWDIWPSWGELALGSEREGKRTAIGDVGGGVVHLAGDRAGRAWDLDWVFHTRADPGAGRMRRWFDGRRGRCFPFWFVSPERPLQPAETLTSIGGSTTVDLEPVGYLRSMRPFPGGGAANVGGGFDHLAIVQNVNGVRTPILRRITNVAEVTVSGKLRERYTLSASVASIPVASIDRIGFARRARFEADELTERWETSEVMRAGARFVEVVNERTVEVGVPTIGASPCGGSGDCCSAGSVEHCSGSPLREEPLLTPEPGSAEESASSPDGFVLGSSGTHFHTKGSVRILARIIGLGNDTKIVRYINAEWDCEVPFTPADLDEANVVEVLIPATYCVEASYALGAGPTTPPAGTATVLRASVAWQYSGGQRVLGITIHGRTNSGDGTDNWLLEASINEDGESNVGGAASGSILLTPVFGVAWETAITQRVGLTGMAARATRHDAAMEMDAVFSVHLCPVYEQ